MNGCLLKISILPALASTAVAITAFGLTGVAGAAGAGRTDTSARLAYVTGKGSPDFVWVRPLAGGRARRLGAGDEPLLSPSGGLVATSRFASRGPSLTIYRTSGGRPAHFFDAAKVSASPAAWSSDSRYLAVELLSSSGTAKGSGLDVIDTRSGRVTRIAAGITCGASFSPDFPVRLVYSRTGGQCLINRSDVYVTTIGRRATRRLTRDGRSVNPLWGAGTIAFDRYTSRGRNSAPALQVWIMHADGTAARQITHLHVPALLDGLVPLGFSADGEHLLTRYEGEDTEEAWTLDIHSGRARQLTAGKHYVSPDAISRDGRSVLVNLDGFEAPPSTGSVAVMSWSGGTPRVLVRHATPGSWNR